MNHVPTTAEPTQKGPDQGRAVALARSDCLLALLNRITGSDPRLLSPEIVALVTRRVGTHGIDAVLVCIVLICIVYALQLRAGLQERFARSVRGMGWQRAQPAVHHGPRHKPEPPPPEQRAERMRRRLERQRPDTDDRRMSIRAVLAGISRDLKMIAGNKRWHRGPALRMTLARGRRPGCTVSGPVWPSPGIAAGRPLVFCTGPP